MTGTHTALTPPAKSLGGPVPTEGSCTQMSEVSEHCAPNWNLRAAVRRRQPGTQQLTRSQITPFSTPQSPRRKQWFV
jgi:hypothetical protein